MSRVCRAARWRQAAAALILAAVAAAAAAASPQTPPAVQTTARPGETTRRPPSAKPGAASDSGIIRGRITGVDGRPLRRADVTLTATRLQQPRRESTDSDGRYMAGGLPADAYTVRASKAGFASAEFGQRRPSYPGKRVTVGESAVVEHIDLVLPRASVVAGRVSDENGDPVMGAGVGLLEVQVLNGRPRLVETRISRRTDDLGRFRLFGVQPGRYVLVASAAPAGPYRLPGYAPAYYPGTASAADAQVITVGAEDEIASIEIRLTPGRAVRVSGTALDPGGAPYLGRLRLVGRERSGALTPPGSGAATLPDGSFTIENVAPGDYVLQTSGFGPFATQFLSVADTDVTGLTIRTTLGSTVSGHITFEGRQRGVRPQDFQFNFVQTDQDLGPAPGTYRAKINDDFTFEYAGLFGPLLIRPAGGPEWMLKSVRAGGVDITDTPTLFGTRDQSLSDVEVILTNRAAGVSGTVTDARGRAVDTCTAIAFAVDRGRWAQQARFVRAARCDADGAFSVHGLPASDYFVAAVDRMQMANGGGEWQDPDVLESLVAGATRITLTDGQTATVSARIIIRSQP